MSILKKKSKGPGVPKMLNPPPPPPPPPLNEDDFVITIKGKGADLLSVSVLKTLTTALLEAGISPSSVSAHGVSDFIDSGQKGVQGL